MSSLKISYHHMGSVTVSSSNRHKYVQAVCYHDTFFLDILTLEKGINWLSQNIRMELPLYAAYNPRREQVSKHIQFQCVFPSEECKMVEYKCVL